MISRWSQQVSRLGKDGFHLARTVFQHQGGNLKPILLDQARDANTVAVSLLKLDKEVGLLRYYGLSGYLQQRLQSTESPTNSTDATSPSSMDAPLGTGNQAKIAFMITTSMKEKLTEGLGYTPEQIKGFTPLQASLILHGSISPQDLEAKLPLAQEEHEAHRKREEQAQREAAAAAAAAARAAAASPVLGEDVSETSGVPHPSAAAKAPQQESRTEDFGGDQGFMSKNLLLSDEPGDQASSQAHQNALTAFGSDEWFEVVEIDDETGASSRVGLYFEQEEAELGLQTRREIAAARSQKVRFEIQRISPETLVQ